MTERTRPSAYLRHEYKYRIDALQEARLRMYASALLSPDPHVDRNGEYLIRSLYFDDIDNGCLRENEDGTDPRSKFRIRIYNGKADRITLEKKAKIRGLCSKVSCLITEGQCREFMRGRVPKADGSLQEGLFYEIRNRKLFPVVIVQYIRRPYVLSTGNVRVTFDRAIGSSRDVQDFLRDVATVRPVLPTGESVLEVKWDAFLPSYIKDHLELDCLRWTSFSKYEMCRRYGCCGGETR